MTEAGRPNRAVNLPKSSCHILLHLSELKDAFWEVNMKHKLTILSSLTIVLALLMAAPAFPGTTGHRSSRHSGPKRTTQLMATRARPMRACRMLAARSPQCGLFVNSRRCGRCFRCRPRAFTRIPCPCPIWISFHYRTGAGLAFVQPRPGRHGRQAPRSRHGRR